MIGALWTGISGLSSQQQALDNESNNIANVNTIGFKASRISFADQMYQDRIGKGSKVLDAEKLYVQGNLRLTGVSYDMALLLQIIGQAVLLKTYILELVTLGWVITVLYKMQQVMRFKVG